MSDSADGTATGLKPGIIQLDSVLTVSCSTGQAGDTILTFARSWTPRPRIGHTVTCGTGSTPAAGRSC